MNLCFPESRAHRLMRAARVPDSLQPQEFGLWRIQRQDFSELPSDVRPFLQMNMGWLSQTVLRRITEATMHIEGGGEIVMEDSLNELRQHLPIWMVARGRVLITGLGLGCVVRGLLAKPEVEHVDVVEIDAGIIKVVGKEFSADPRVTIHHGDALSIDLPGRWDFAWHDLWTESGSKPHLQFLHVALIGRFNKRVGRQGAWKFPKDIKRRCGPSILK